MMNKIFLKSIVAFPTVSQNLAAGNDITFDKRQQLSRTAIVNDLQPKAPKFVSLSLNSYSHFAFMVSAATAFAATFTTKVELIGFNLSRQGLAVRENCAGSELLQPAPSSAIAAKTKHFLQGNSINARLAGRKPPQGLEPNGQRFFSPVQDRTRGDRSLFLALSAQIEIAGTLPVKSESEGTLVSYVSYC